jgi:hypothetical protein
MISFGKLRRALRASLEASPGRAGIFQVPPLHTWSEGHGRFKTNELTFSTAMPRDRRIAHPFIQIQVESDYFKIICVSQIILFASSICESSCFSVHFVPKSAQAEAVTLWADCGTEHGRHAVRVIDNAPGTRPSRVTNFNVDARMLKVMMVRDVYVLTIFLHLLSISVLARVIF